ncbi:MAG: peptidase M16, partial [Desulfuromonadaceae bacterium]|nr:peptidase M16 [Desulfuromonadaceae bacterium]
GTFSLLSYRDPHVQRTLDVYDAAARWAARGDFDDAAIKEAIIAVFADLDRPLSPGGRGAREFANQCQGLTCELRQQMRAAILDVDHEHLVAVAEHYLVAGREHSAVAVVASEELLQTANTTLAEKLEIRPV